jgi:hypothetical protein
MSLFEDDQYRWRETYFVLFNQRRRPSAETVRLALSKLGDRYVVGDVRLDEQGQLESLTVYSPSDFSAMDISYIQGEEVGMQVAELQQEMRAATLTKDDLAKLARLPECNARFDIFHFEQVVGDAGDDEFLDPGALLVVLEKLGELCQGVSVDPQTGSFM